MVSPAPLVSDDPARQIRLARMKRRATALLVFAAAVLAVAVAWEGAYPWLGYVRATAEAAVVGGVADWFAVTALFRHPLGIPIPHTAIVPARKDRIGASLGRFVQRNFLVREVLTERLHALTLGARLMEWIARPEQGERLAHTLAHTLAQMAQAFKDEDVQALIDRALVERVRRVPVAPLVGNVLGHMTADNRHQALLDEALRLVGRTVRENEALIREGVRAESPWWIPEGIDDKIHDRIVSGIERTLQAIGEDPEHPLRLRFDTALRGLIDRLQYAPETAARAEALKEQLLEQPAMREFSARLWTEAKTSLVQYAEEQEGSEAQAAVARGLRTLSEGLKAHPDLLAKLDRWLADVLIDAIEQYREPIGRYIAETVRAWDPQATSRKIELQIGSDLQFVRINGTLVGGLVGLLLYSAVQWLG